MWVWLAAACVLLAQNGKGQLRLEVRDPSGASLAALAELVSQSADVKREFATDTTGHYTARGLPFGVYRIKITKPGFQPVERLVEIRSEVPVRVSEVLSLVPVETQIEVSDAATLVDPAQTATVYTVGRRGISESMSAQPGRSLLDLVANQPGWMYEANGVLHPRESEYGVQLVVDGMPMLENRSPSSAPGLEAEEFDSVQVKTAGFPAEYGRKLGGVVELTAPRNAAPGLHGQLVAGGGSFNSLDGFAGIAYARGVDAFSINGSSARTDRYLDPPTLGNFNDQGTSGGITASYSRDLTNQDRLRFSFAHRNARLEVPNELLQQLAGQRQDRSSGETSGQISYQRTLSASLLFSAQASARDDDAKLWSNELSTPIIVDQERGFRETYARVDLAGHQGHHDWKIGTDTIFGSVHEGLTYSLTDLTQFDPGTQPHFIFSDRRQDREQAGYAQDQIKLGPWNIGAGLRFDHYRLVAKDSAWSPRLSVSRYFPSMGLLAHASYDRVMQTPALENLLLASSPELDSVSNLVVRLPVRPSRANYYEAGLTKGILGKLRLDVNVFRRDAKNFADDDVLLNTGVGFPISFAEAHIQGLEAKAEVAQWGRFSGYASYTNQRGMGKGPITGGLFLGDKAGSVADTSTFTISQDQRNIARAYVRCQIAQRLWISSTGTYQSGLPVDLDPNTDIGSLEPQYGEAVLRRVNFSAGRVRPSFSFDAAVGGDIFRADRGSMTFQVQGQNLTDRLNVINFASLFSGTAIGPPRSLTAQIRLQF